VNEAGMRNNWTDVHCAAHVLHLCVTSAMGITNVKSSTKPIARCIGAASHLVGHFHHSPLATNELVKRQKEMRPKETTKKLVQHCKTRWNSAFDMIERLVELRWPVVAVLSDRDVTKQADAKTLDLKEEHWDLMKNLSPIFQPLQQVTAILSGEKSPPASLCIPMVWGLIKNHLAEKNTDDAVIGHFKADVVAQLTKRFPLSEAEVGHPFVVASILDPAQKLLKAVPDTVRDAAYTNIRALLSNITLSDRVDVEEKEKPAKRHCPALEFILGKQYNESETVTADAELDSYLSDATSNGEALEFWKQNATKYPRVASRWKLRVLPHLVLPHLTGGQ
jgi:hypothetical protein